MLKAVVRPVAAGGVIVFDPATRRVTAAEEQFRVVGTVTVSALGTEATVGLEEQQAFRLTVTEPAERRLIGRPPGR